MNDCVTHTSFWRTLQTRIQTFSTNLALRHSLSKRTILLAQGAKHIPSDIRGYWLLIYGISPKKIATFKSELRRITEQIDSDPEKSDSPVSDYMERENVVLSRDAQRQNLRKLGALFTELTGNALVVSELSSNSDALPLVSYGCLALLLETLYVDPGPEVLKRAYELRKCLQLIKRGNFGAILPVTTKTLQQLILDVEAIRNKVAAGPLDEPPNPTMMQWIPGFGLPSDIPLPGSYLGGDDVYGLCIQAAAPLSEDSSPGNQNKDE
ncbi:hypothetical protein Noc_1102 [Nitrosococcus oceani ATCC 19707]|uniref:Uncharacterized protein n=2 Tax=Nitrosococcus oceani TaxID=1229 RepID=Q3JC40_NITOC|nr:hypothetical protein Noc_1102 [Nitrosococcus oceani ATCC 19707]EDZ67658.1 hypothetical protein NOC27_985 [Nitrosococcus oceani AFC27]KFI19891.1 hypothetical protein IB75_05680 [Nitrosococcus oceani C-27]